MYFGGDEDDEDQPQEDTIPGDNDKPSDEVQKNTDGTAILNAPVNLTHIPASGGDVPVVLEKK